MSLSSDQKEAIAERVVQILRSPEKNQLIAELRKRVYAHPAADGESAESVEAVIYAVLQALEELYG